MTAVDVVTPAARSRARGTPVQRQLEEMMLAGRLEAGGKLDETALAGRLGVSKRPVREAIFALAEAGLVRLHKHRGAFVREISIVEADEIYELRAAFDRMAGRRLARAIRADQLAGLRAIVDRMRACASAGDLARHHAENLRFHDALICYAGNAKLAQVYRRLVNELSLFRRRALDAPRRAAASTREHARIVELIAAGDADAAGDALDEHAMASRARLHACS
ncbi:MAG TPA: FCD domain-containing protein [Caldimonas sp.]|nr:FCD domain-containing protein [Caldimonas sp.]